MEDSGKTCSWEAGEVEEKARQVAWDRCLCEGVLSSMEPTGVSLLGVLGISSLPSSPALALHNSPIPFL